MQIYAAPKRRRHWARWLALILALAVLAAGLWWTLGSGRPPAPQPGASAAANSRSSSEALLQNLEASVAAGDWQAANRLEDELAAAGPAAVPFLRKLLESGEGGPARLVPAQRAAWILGRIGGPQALDALTAALERPSALELRGQALLALSRLSGPEAPTARRSLEAVLFSEQEDRTLRRDAALLLAKTPDAGGTDLLVEAVRGARAPETLPWIVEALGFSSQRRPAAECLRSLAAQPEEKLRAAVFRALRRLEGVGALDLLGPALQKEASPRLRQEIVRALGEGEPGAESGALLARTLEQDADPGVRALAAQALGRAGVTASLAVLERCLSREADEYICIRSLESVGKVGGKEAEGVLERVAAAHTLESLRRRAEAELARLRGTPQPKIEVRPSGEPGVEKEEEHF
jgi:HEAT repeat protein